MVKKRQDSAKIATTVLRYEATVHMMMVKIGPLYIVLSLNILIFINHRGWQATDKSVGRFSLPWPWREGDGTASRDGGKGP